MQVTSSHRLVVLLAVVAAAAASTCSSARGSPERPSPSGVQVAVTKTTDGDTFHVLYQGRDDRVRFIGVDTPEVDWYGGHAECFGSEAGLYTRSRLAGRTVGLVFDVNQRDTYGRLLAYVYVGAELFNLTLVQRGYARADPVPPDTKMAALFARAGDVARAAGKGLWSACPA